MFKWILYFLCSLPALAFAERSVSSYISNQSLHFGDSATIVYSLKLHSDDFIDFSHVFFDNPYIYIRSVYIDSSLDDYSKTFDLKIAFSCFANSNFDIPEKVFVVENTNHSSVLLKSDPISITFLPVLIDSSKGLRPLKGLMTYSKPIRFLPWLIIASLIVIASFLFFYLKRKPKKAIKHNNSLDKQISEFNSFSINSKYDFEEFLKLFKIVCSNKLNLNLESLTLSEINSILKLNISNELINKIDSIRFSESHFDYQAFNNLCETMKLFVINLEISANDKH